MKLKERKTKIEFPVFHYTVNVIITNNIIASRKKLDKILGFIYEEEEVDDEFTGGMHSYNNSNTFCSYIIINPFSDAKTVAHESFHAVCRMFKAIGENDAGEEIWAYTLGHLVGTIDKFLKKK